MRLTFPDSFLWGVAASAYQIEGAAREDGRGESIWDRFSHQPYRTLNGDTGDVACDHYHRMPEDVAMMAELGIPCYGFTVAWPRILPEGRGRVNQKGLDFYNRLVDTLLEHGIRPKVTLFHWDLPQVLQDEGGWPNRDCPDWFADYARVVFDALSDRVDLWATINEPWVAAFIGYGMGIHAPGIQDAAQAYQAAHHLNLAHGKAVQLFREGGYKGEIGYVLNLNGLLPGSDRPEDIEATQRLYDETHSFFLDPVFRGTYPEALFSWLGTQAPKVHDGDLDIIQTPIDFLGINHYNTDLVFYDVMSTHWLKVRSVPYSAPGWGQTEMGWGINPPGIKREIMNVVERYGNPKIIITENGCAMPDEPDENGFVADWNRIFFLKAHLQQVHEAIQEGANVQGYFVWSILDNFEWERGYSRRFGLVRVDYETLRRIPKQSAYWYGDVIRENALTI